jgi:uncharacterized protein (DUF302 family)
MSQPTQNPAYGFGVTLSLPFAEAVARVTEALQQEGFGTLTTIDVQVTLKTKLDVDYQPYTILGACNPALAHRALTIDPDIGLLLPCNVVVRELPTGVRVDIADPAVMLGIVQNAAMQAVADEARAKLQQVIARLQASSQA